MPSHPPTHPPPLRRHMQTKTLATIRSHSQGIETKEMVAENALDPSTYWMKLVMMKERIQALVDRGLLRPKMLLEWKAYVG